MPVVTGDGARRVGSMANTVGTMYQPNAYCYKVVVENASNTAIDLRAEDDATDEAVEAIIKELKLREPNFEQTAEYGHFGNNFIWG